MSGVSLLPLVKWIADTWIGRYVRHSSQAVPLTGNVHMLAWVVLVGVVIVVNLSALNIAVKVPIPSRIARELWPYFLASVGTAVASGVVILTSNAISYYFNPIFRTKMALFAAAAILFTVLLVHLKGLGERAVTWPWKLVAWSNLFLWFGTLMAGRFVGLY